MEKSLGVEVINAGISGYSTDQELLWMQTEGAKYDFDLIVLVFTGNDIGDNQRQIVNTIYYKPQFVIKDGYLVLTGNPVPKASVQEKTIYFASQRSALAFFLVQRWFGLQTLYDKFKSNQGEIDGPGKREAQINSEDEVVEAGPEEGPFELTVALLDEIRNFANAKDAGLIIVATDRWWNHPSGAGYNDFINSLEANKYLVLDIEAMSNFDPEQMVIPDDGHWNKLGHEFVAEKIEEVIAEQHLLSVR
jgi:lysophospholipase L1-like esterase